MPRQAYQPKKAKQVNKVAKNTRSQAKATKVQSSKQIHSDAKELKIQNKKNTKKGQQDADEEKKAAKFLFGENYISEEDEGDNDNAIAGFQQGNKKISLTTNLSENEISDACDEDNDSEEEPLNEDDILKAEEEFYANAKKHENDKEKEKPFYCDNHKKGFNTEEKYLDHVKNHDPIIANKSGICKFHCKWCNRGFTYRKNRNSHEIACLRAPAGIRQRANQQDLKKKEQLKLIRNQLNFKV